MLSVRSTNSRYTNVYDDIYQHQVWNYDWGDGWIFTDPRINLLQIDDAEFLELLAGMFVSPS